MKSKQMLAVAGIVLLLLGLSYYVYVARQTSDLLVETTEDVMNENQEVLVVPTLESEEETYKEVKALIDTSADVDPELEDNLVDILE